MELKNINSLVELFFRKSEENIPKKYSLNEPAFLTNLKHKDHELAELKRANFVFLEIDRRVYKNII